MEDCSPRKYGQIFTWVLKSKSPLHLYPNYFFMFVSLKKTNKQSKTKTSFRYVQSRMLKLRNWKHAKIMWTQPYNRLTTVIALQIVFLQGNCTHVHGHASPGNQKITPVSNGTESSASPSRGRVFSGAPQKNGLKQKRADDNIRLRVGRVKTSVNLEMKVAGLKHREYVSHICITYLRLNIKWS